uniref:Uncharacterized protein n=1 Tax=Synechococcus phage S-CAM8 TaxID=754038 RepID=G8EY17_9CAUD
MIGLQSGYEVHEFSSLTSVGVTDSAQTAGVSLMFQVTVSGVSGNLVLRFEGSLDNVSFFNLDQDNEDTRITANGTTGYALNGCPVKYARVRLVSIGGGTPTVAAKVGAA